MKNSELKKQFIISYKAIKDLIDISEPDLHTDLAHDHIHRILGMTIDFPEKWILEAREVNETRTNEGTY